MMKGPLHLIKGNYDYDMHFWILVKGCNFVNNKIMCKYVYWPLTCLKYGFIYAVGILRVAFLYVSLNWFSRHVPSLKKCVWWNVKNIGDTLSTIKYSKIS